MSDDHYVDPIARRYASEEMVSLFTPRRRALVWRDLWIALAEAEHEAGLSVTAEQVDALRAARDTVDLDRVAELERELRHDVMAHIHHYGELAPAARGVLHLGATSCYVTDNGDLILYRRALELIATRLLRAIHALADFARREADRPTLGFTHLQPAQLTTVGKRAALWLQDWVDVHARLAALVEELPFRGVKGTTGTQASFLHLFGGNAAEVRALEASVARKLGFDSVFALTGQTYPRMWDYRIASVLGELAVVLHKFSTDMRLLQSWGELEEPYRSTQIGSSAMPYKRNPMRAERLGSLAKWLLSIPDGLGSMAATQWMERTLDDSALRRIALPQAFMTADAILILAHNIASGIVVHGEVVARRVGEYLPFMAAEELLMEATSSGGDRQDLHERIRKLSWQVHEEMRGAGGENRLQALIEGDEVLGPVMARLPDWAPERFTGLAAEQTRHYLDEVVARLPEPPDDGITDLSV